MRDRHIEKKDKGRERKTDRKTERKVSPRKQYPAGNRPADRTLPMRALEDLSSQHAVVHECCCSMSSCNR